MIYCRSELPPRFACRRKTDGISVDWAVADDEPEAGFQHAVGS